MIGWALPTCKGLTATHHSIREFTNAKSLVQYQAVQCILCKWYKETDNKGHYHMVWKKEYCIIKMWGQPIREAHTTPAMDVYYDPKKKQTTIQIILCLSLILCTTTGNKATINSDFIWELHIPINVLSILLYYTFITTSKTKQKIKVLPICTNKREKQKVLCLHCNIHSSQSKGKPTTTQCVCV